MNELQYRALQYQITVDEAQPSVKYLLNRKECAHQALSMHVINLTHHRINRGSIIFDHPSTSTPLH
jgi:hypothetical protein